MDMSNNFYDKLQQVIDESFQDEELWFEKFNKDFINSQVESDPDFDKVFEENFWDIKA